METQLDYDRAFGRSAGLISETQQRRLRDSAVAIAGCGGDGGLVAERLARAGVGELRLADPECFEIENVNRQFAADVSAMGRNKAEVVAAAVRGINPDIRLRVYPEGVSAANVAEFVGGASVAVDEIEYSLPTISLMLAAEARRVGIPTIIGANVAFGANVFAIHPRGRTLEEHYRTSGGVLGDGEKAALAQARALCPRVPGYVDWHDLQTVMLGQRPVPSVSQAVAAVAAVVSQEVVGHICGLSEMVWLPRYIELDLLRRAMRVRRATAAGFYMSILSCRLKSIFR